MISPLSFYSTDSLTDSQMNEKRWRKPAELLVWKGKTGAGLPLYFKLCLLRRITYRLEKRKRLEQPWANKTKNE